MSKRGLDFLENWIDEHVNAQPYLDESGDPRPTQFAQECAAAAKEAGISLQEIEEEVGNLEGRMGGSR